MTNNETLHNIFLQVVKDMAYDPPYQIDTFRLNENNPDFSSSSYGSTYQDYLSGAFWSRTFEHGGANPNEFCGGYPVLMAETDSMTIESLEDNRIAIEYWFLVVDKIPCEACPPHITRNGLTVSKGVIQMLRAFLNELLSYKYYEVDRDGTVTFEWMSEGRAAYEVSEGNTVVETDELLPDMGYEDIEIKQWGNDPNTRAWYAKIRFEICEPFTANFNYEQPVISKLAKVECDVC